MARLLGLLLLVVGLLLLAAQNPLPLLPLVVFGRPMVVLPLGWWLAGAVAAGAATMGLIGLLVQLGRPPRRPVIDRRPAPESEQSRSPRQRLINQPLGDELEDEWGSGESANEGQAKGQPGNASWRSRLFSLQAEPRPSATAAELEQELADWTVPDRPQKGWNHDPEWDEWSEAAPDSNRTQPSPPRSNPSPPQDRPRSTNRIDRPFDPEPAPARPQAPQATSSKPEPKPLEAPARPAATRREGTSYSIRYQRDEDNLEEPAAEAPKVEMPEKPATSAATPKADRAATAQGTEPSKPESELPPPAERSRSVTDAEYRVLTPPAPQSAAPQVNDWDRSAPDDDWDDNW